MRRKPLTVNTIKTTEYTWTRYTLQAQAAFPVSSPVTVAVTDAVSGSELCRITIPAGQTTARATYIPSSQARVGNIAIVSASHDTDYRYVVAPTTINIRANGIRLDGQATATRVTYTAQTAVFSDVKMTVRSRTSPYPVICVVTVPAGETTGYTDIEPASEVRYCELGWEPDDDAYASYTLGSIFIDIPKQQ